MPDRGPRDSNAQPWISDIGMEEKLREMDEENARHLGGDEEHLPKKFRGMGNLTCLACDAGHCEEEEYHLCYNAVT